MAAERKQWDMEKKEIAERVQNSEAILKLNVGGKEKEVSRELLTSVKSSLLEKTFSGKHVLK